MTEKEYKILKAIERGSYDRGINAKAIAWTLWGDDPQYEYLFSACSNQGYGACRGKKAWLCAGSLVGKLRKRGLVDYDRHCTGYVLCSAGRQALADYEEIHKNQNKYRLHPVYW